MTRMLIDHGALITVDPERRIVDDGAISILDSQIEHVGPRREVVFGHFDRELEVSLDTQIETCRTAIQHWHGAADGRIQLAVVSPAVHPARLAEPELLAAYNEQASAARALSRELRVLFTQDGHHHGSLRHAHHQLGLLGPDALLSHATDLGDDEVALCAGTGTRIAHNPSAIASIRGRCPVPELLDAGVTVGLGSDAAGPDRSGDMFRHMQQCMHYHRRHFRDPGILPPGKVLEMATIDAARALGLEASIGSLEAGKQADLVLVNLRRPHLWPPDMPLYRVVYYANGNDVDTVLVGGRVLMHGRALETIDEPAILDAAQRESTLARERCGLTHLQEMPAGLWGASHF